MRLIGHAAAAAIAAGIVYIVVLVVAFPSYDALYGPWDRDRSQAGGMIGLAVSTLPYAASGLYARFAMSGRRRYAILVGALPTLLEKIAVYAIGAWFVALGGDGDGNGDVTADAVFEFVWAEALPYYTPWYCLWGTLLGAAVGTAACVWPSRKKPDGLRDKGEGG